MKPVTAVALVVSLALACLSAVVAPTLVAVTGSPSEGVPEEVACGWHSPTGTDIVAASSQSAAVSVNVSEPSWMEQCTSYPGPDGSSSAGASVAYEVFPVTISAPAGSSLTLSWETPTPSPEQLAIGVRTNELWVHFDPAVAVAGPGGTVTANLTLAGAVMPFVPNPVSNVSLPVVVTSKSG